MLILQEKQLSTYSKCSYIKDISWRFEYFFAVELNQSELNQYLSTGWRKFGLYYFRPRCNHCNKCIPLRVLVDQFKPSKSQKRVITKCKDITVKLNPLNYRSEIFKIYQDHSKNRFNRESDEEEFISTFYTQSCPTLQSEYYLNEQLIAVGYIDVSNEAFSSIYFIYHTSFERYSLGTFSVLKEIELAASLHLKYYYLGYYIKENKSMNYKNKFLPYQYYDWDKETWIQDYNM